MLIALIPAHNEEDKIENAIDSLLLQSIPPDEVIVVLDNCTDDTKAICNYMDIKTFTTKDNIHKKAGALNQCLDTLLPKLSDDDIIFVVDADSIIDSAFIYNAMPYIQSETYGAVGGVFRGSDGNGFIGHLQRNEYARYARDVRNLGGQCLVVTGTSAMFRVSVLREIIAGRKNGLLPAGNSVYDTSVLTEDNEISFAVQTLGYKLISPKGCYLVTDIMPTWKDLWRQRLRWKRGAVENCFQYGISKVTFKYWLRQLLTFLGIIITIAYLFSLGYCFYVGQIHIALIWIIVTGIFIVERSITVRYLGIKQMILSALMYELILDFFLQAVHAKAFYDTLFKRKRAW